MTKRIDNILIFAVVFFTALFLAVTDAHAQDLLEGQRIYGIDRYQTSIGISGSGWKNGGSEVVVLATGEDFPDALSAAPLAKKYNAPILLTNSNSLDTAVSAELARLGTKKVYIVGGQGAVSESVEYQIKARGIECVRIYGNDRYETSAAVANEIGETDRIVVATGEDFPDALSIAPWAAANGAPILLTERDRLPQSTKDYIKKTRIKTTYVIGGTGVVSNAVMSGLPGASRIYGQDRFGTNAAVLDRFTKDFNFKKLYLATGNDFPDALSGSALAALSDSPIVLTDIGALPNTKKIVDKNAANIEQVFILGGEGAVSNISAGSVVPPTFIGLEYDTPDKAVIINKPLRFVPKAVVISDEGVSTDDVYRDITYTVSDPTVAKVEEDGTITGLKLGETKVTAATGKKSASVNIIVRMDKLIILDPGHGGSSPGAVPNLASYEQEYASREAVLNMQIVQKIKNKLADSGIQVVLTRNGDDTVSLEERAELANKLEAELFISIHHDASTSTSGRGTSAYYSSNKPTTDIVKQSEELARIINNGIVGLGLKSRGVVNNNFAVNRLSNMASVLVEVGFITNSDEFNMITKDSFQEQVADVIARAVIQFYDKYQGML